MVFFINKDIMVFFQMKKDNNVLVFTRTGSSSFQRKWRGSKSPSLLARRLPKLQEFSMDSLFSISSYTVLDKERVPTVYIYIFNRAMLVNIFTYI
jgi:hypothetical protein